MKTWNYVEEMLSNETVKAYLIKWAVKFAHGKTDRESAMKACNHVCAIWRQTITPAVIARLEKQIKIECAIDIKQRDLDDGVVDCEAKLVTAHSLMTVIERYNLKPDDEGNYRITDSMVDEAEEIDKEKGVMFRTIPTH